MRVISYIVGFVIAVAIAILVGYGIVDVLNIEPGSVPRFVVFFLCGFVAGMINNIAQAVIWD